MKRDNIIVDAVLAAAAIVLLFFALSLADWWHRER